MKLKGNAAAGCLANITKVTQHSVDWPDIALRQHHIGDIILLLRSSGHLASLVHTRPREWRYALAPMWSFGLSLSPRTG